MIASSMIERKKVVAFSDFYMIGKATFGFTRKHMTACE
jgi:hypothetical protein